MPIVRTLPTIFCSKLALYWQNEWYLRPQAEDWVPKVQLADPNVEPLNAEIEVADSIFEVLDLIV